ncbi:hypothetical protein [Hymenobacter sp.]|jgi:hypothetical protein|uniref:hypothetical protein n=1 Tax=Hymenobacter sp. TaxID=1898978 RepID=UPI002EDB7889
MKFLLYGAVFTATVVFAQTDPAPDPTALKPFKGANLIKVATPDSVGLALSKIKQILVAQGYQLDSVAPNRLTTKGRSFDLSGSAPKQPILHVFKVRASPTTKGGADLTFMGEYSQDLGPKYHFTFPMRWLATQSTAYNQVCFNYAEKVAKAYPKGLISYQQKP